MPSVTPEASSTSLYKMGPEVMVARGVGGDGIWEGLVWKGGNIARLYVVQSVVIRSLYVSALSSMAKMVELCPCRGPGDASILRKLSLL